MPLLYSKPRVKKSASIQNTATEATTHPATTHRATESALQAKAMYDASRTGRRTKSWQPTNTGPNSSIQNLDTMRNRVRDLGRNEWSSEAATRTRTVDIVGTGIVARSTAKNPQLKAKLNALWAESCKEMDADGVLDFHGLTALATRSWDESGEVFARIRYRRLSDGLAVPMQVQLIEGDQIPLLNTTVYPGLQDGNSIRSGIEIDRIGRRVAVWAYKTHPGDGYVSSITDASLTRIPIDEILHIFQPKRPGARRGVPNGISTVIKGKNVADYDDAVTEKAKIQNLFSGVITRPAPAPGMENVDPVTGQIIEYADGSNSPMVGLEPGGMIELAPGENIVFSSPPPVGVGYNDFMRQQYLAISSGRSVPYELLTGDIVNVSDRTLRVIIQNYRRGIESDQWLTVIPMLCQKIRDKWIDSCVLAGLISISEVEDARCVEWSPQAWAYIHPVQDAQSKIMEINAGIASRDDVIASRGNDAEAVDMSRSVGKKREVKLGLSDAADKTTSKKLQAKLFAMLDTDAD